MFQKSYSEKELVLLLKNTHQRRGWDFASMKTQRQTVPWEYFDVVSLYLTPESLVLDIGTGGGENFIKFSRSFKSGIGVDIDQEMIEVARENAKDVQNVMFYQDSERLENTTGQLDLIINRHAPFDLNAVVDHLHPGGYLITQQVGEKNMLNIKQILNKVTHSSVISKEQIAKAGFKITAFMEYNVEYIVKDVASLVFWLQALDMLHADLPGREALTNVDVFNKILEGNVDERGFITNEHRYLAIAQK